MPDSAAWSWLTHVVNPLAGPLRTGWSRETSAGTIHLCSMWSLILHQDSLNLLSCSVRIPRHWPELCKAIRILGSELGYSNLHSFLLAKESHEASPDLKTLHFLMAGAAKFYSRRYTYRMDED